MPQFAVEFHPLAADEAQAAERWYRERNEIASGRFQRELDSAIELISERPEAGSPYLNNTRRILLRRFPFFVVYRIRSDAVQVVAVAHARRRPGYWRRRPTQKSVSREE
jgi:toxin ParE1/3/4